MTQLPTLAAAALLCSAPLLGQTTEEGAGEKQTAVEAIDGDEVPPEGHSHFGEAFNEGPRQAAYLMPNSGSVHFPISTEDEYVQDYGEAPHDGSAHGGSGSADRVVSRGGSRGSVAKTLRSAVRLWDHPFDRYTGKGFRPAQSVTLD